MGHCHKNKKNEPEMAQMKDKNKVHKIDLKTSGLNCSILHVKYNSLSSEFPTIQRSTYRI